MTILHISIESEGNAENERSSNQIKKIEVEGESGGNC